MKRKKSGFFYASAIAFLPLLWLGCIPCLDDICNCLCKDVAEERKSVGLIQLIELDEIQGLLNWCYELDQRGLKSLIFVQKALLEKYPTEIKWMADQGHEVAGGSGGQTLWDVDYQTQYDIMRQTQELVEQTTGKPMRVFGSKYFAYDETTLQVADELGIPYILGRGTTDVEAVIYEPEEYEVKIISVSNVPFGPMGRGSLCDYSLWARGSTAAEFDQMIQESLAKKPKRIMYVSHAYLGGMKKAWWEAYKKLLDSEDIQWAEDFDEWVKPENGVNLTIPMSLIPVNREVKYLTPTPSEPLEGMEDVDNMYNPCGAP